MSEESSMESFSNDNDPPDFQPPDFQTPKEHDREYIDRRMEKNEPMLNKYSEPNSLGYSPSSSVFESEDSANFESDAFEHESGVESVDGDWLTSCDTPPSDFDMDLTEEQALETLKYFTLSLSRANQMTKTHQDLDAVLQLLQEKEKDLELAAHIGQSLLERNRNLYKKTEVLEDYVNEVEERETQLKHIVSMKDKLLKTFADDEDEEGNDYSLLNKYSESNAYESCKDESMLSLHDKCNQLEQKNSNLIVETLKLREETDKVEEKENELVYECIRKLAEQKEQISNLTDEIFVKAEDNIEHQEEISNLKYTVVDLQDKHNHLTEENEGLHETLKHSQEHQNDLQTEVSGLHEKYRECFDMLLENQREMKVMKEKLGSSSQSDSSSPGFLRQDPRDSLAQEIEETVRRDLETTQDKKKHTNRVMQTVRVANTTKRFPKAIKAGTRPSKGGQAKPADKPFDFTFAVSANSAKKERGDEPPTMDELRAAVRRLSVSENSPQGQRGRRSWAPEKLQIVKPMEGSATLHKWQSLARPSMSGLHTVLPGIHVKGETALQSEPTDVDALDKSGDIIAAKQKNQASGISKSGISKNKKTSKVTRKDEKDKTTAGSEKQSDDTAKSLKEKQSKGDDKGISLKETTITSEPNQSLVKPVTIDPTSNLTEILKSKLASEQAVTSENEPETLLSKILRSRPAVSCNLVNSMPVTTVAKTSFVPTTMTTASSAMPVTAFPRPLLVRSRSSENLMNLIKPLNKPESVDPTSGLNTESLNPPVAASQGFGGFVGRLVRSSSNENLAGTKNAKLGFSRSSSSGKLSDLIKNADLHPVVGKASSFDTVQDNKRALFHLGTSPPSPSQLELGGFAFFGPSSSSTPAVEAPASKIPAPSTSRSMFGALSGLGGFFRPRSKSMDNLGPLPASFGSTSPTLKQRNSSRVERSLKQFNQVFGPD